jgi:hypothetical protein
MAPRILVLSVFIGTAVLAACGGGGGGVTPSGGGSTPTPAPSASATATPTPSATATPTSSSSSAPAFTGGTQTKSLTSSGGTFSITTADAGYTASATFGSNNATAAFNMTMSWATYPQITGTFAPGPLPTTIGTALLYLDFHVNTTVTFSQTPAVSVTTTGTFPGSKCGFAVYGNAGSGGTGSPAWFSMTSIGISEVSPSGSSFTVPAATLGGGGTVQFDPSSDTYIALYCH